MSGRGRLVAFEGGEGTGKSTQARLLAASLDALLTREPGGTVLGERVRELVLDPSVEMAHRTEALLMAAARAEHVAEVIEPALVAGRHVVTDRFTASSVAYQGYGRGLGAEEVRELSHWATGGLEPDLVVLLEVPASVLAGRLDRELDRMELEGGEFHDAVAAGFRAQAAEDATRWVVLDGARPVADLATEILTTFHTRFGST